MRRPNLLSSLPWAMPLALALVVPLPGYGSQNLLANPDFDVDVTGWTLETSSGVQLAWDPVQGDPVPGSLRLSGSDGGLGFVAGEALSECFDAPVGTRFAVRTRILAEAADADLECLPFLTRYDGPGCSGNRTFLGGSGARQFNQVGVWESRSSTGEITAGLPSFRVSLFFQPVTGLGPASCNFDSVVLFEQGSASVLEVPTLSRVGLLALLAAFAASALWLLRRVS